MNLEKKHICAPSLHQDLYQKLTNHFSIYIPKSFILTILNEKDLDLILLETVFGKNSEKSITDKKTYESTEEIKCPQEDEDGGVFILNDLNERRPILGDKFCLKYLQKISFFYIQSRSL